MFSCEFSKFFKNIFLVEQFQATGSEYGDYREYKDQRGVLLHFNPNIAFTIEIKYVLNIKKVETKLSIKLNVLFQVLNQIFRLNKKLTYFDKKCILYSFIKNFDSFTFLSELKSSHRLENLHPPWKT